MADSVRNSDGPNNRPDEWTVVRCGLAGVCLMGTVCLLRFLAAIPRLFTEDWTWTELGLLPLQVVVLGFFPGAVTGVLLPLRRFGRLGQAIIGAACADVYLLACFALFEFDGLIHARLVTVLTFAVLASLVGGAFGIIIAHDIHEENRRASASDEKPAG